MTIGSAQGVQMSSDDWTRRATEALDWSALLGCLTCRRPFGALRRETCPGPLGIAPLAAIPGDP